VFRDDAAPYLVYYLHLGEGESWREREAGMAKLAAAVFGAEPAAPRPPRCRLATNRRAFIEKIALHLNGLDDRVVEYVKYQIFRRPDGNIDPLQHELLYDFSSQTAGQLAFIVYLRKTGAPTAAAHLPMDVYHEVADVFGAGAGSESELDRLFPGAYVSVDRLL
jgi:hypothetical protein